MIRFSRVLASLVIVIAAVATVVAQSAKPDPGRAASARPTGTTGTSAAELSTASATSTGSVQQSLQEILEEPTTTDTYRYDPQGRRDPFQSLVGPRPTLQPGQRPPGVPGFLIDEMKLQGIFKTKQGLVAMITGPDNKGHLIRVGDKVLDGEVIRITTSGLVFRQEVNDPTRIERYREVVKDLVPSAGKK